MAKIRVDYSKYNPIFFMVMLMQMREYIVNSSADTAKGAIGMDRIRKLKIIVPPLTLQNEFSELYKQIDKSKFICHSRYFLCEILTFMSSTIAYSNVVSIFE